MDFSEKILVKMLLVLAIVVMLLRWVPVLRGGLLLALFLLIVIGVCWYFFNRKSQPKEDQDQLLQAIQQKILECEEQIAQFRKEASLIRLQYQELEGQMNKVGAENTVEHQRGVDLLTKLDNEMSLRLAKAAFFESSLVQLQKMLENRRLQQKLEESEAALQQWQDDNFTGLEDISSMSERIRLDQRQLELISELAQRAAISPNLQQAVALRKELEAIEG